MPLSEVAHLGAPPDRDLRVGHAGAPQDTSALGFHLLEEPVDELPVGRGQALGRGPHEIERERRGQQPVGRERARAVRDEHARHPQDAADLPGVHRPRAAEGEERVAAQVLAALDPVHARGGRHVLVDHPVDAPGGLDDAQAHRLRHARLDRPAGRLHVEPHPAAQEEVGVEVAQEEVGVGDRRLLPARSVAGRARIGARAVRPDLQETHAIHPRHRAAARPDLDQLHHRHPDREAGALLEAVGARDLELAREERLAAIDHAGLGGGAAHVEGEQPVQAHLPGAARRRERARGGARLDEPDRDALGGLRGGDAARGHHDVEPARDPELLQLALEVVEVARHQRHHVHVRGGGGGALVLADLRHHVGGAGDRNAREDLRAQRGEGPLVDRIAVGVEQADRDGLHAQGPELRDGRARLDRVERAEDGGPVRRPHVPHRLEARNSSGQCLGITAVIDP